MSGFTEYERLSWRHTSPDDPVEFHYEIDGDGNVPRMIEVFADGRVESNTMDWERRQHPLTQGDSLVEGDMSKNSEMRTLPADNPDFEVSATSREAFEALFRRAKPKYDRSGGQS